MKEEIFVQQSDGRLVAGPSLAVVSPKPKNKLKFLVFAAVWFSSIVFSFWQGSTFNSPASSLHEQVINRLQDGCVFQFKGISTTEMGRLELEQQAKDAVDILENQDNSRNIKWSSVPAEDGVRKMDPTAKQLVVVSWEVCR